MEALGGSLALQPNGAEVGFATPIEGKHFKRLPALDRDDIDAVACFNGKHARAAARDRGALDTRREGRTARYDHVRAAGRNNSWRYHGSGSQLASGDLSGRWIRLIEKGLHTVVERLHPCV